MMRTKAEFLFKADANQDKAEHVGKYVNNTSMQPDASEHAPTLPPTYHIAQCQSPHL